MPPHETAEEKLYSDHYQQKVFYVEETAAINICLDLFKLT